MSLFAIADVHLSLGSEKPMDIFGGWDDYQERLENNWRKVVQDKDTVVIAGDISWAMSLEQALPDFRFLQSLPGQKLILKGNHDYWWMTRAKMDKWLSENGLSTIKIIHNSTEVVGDIAVCGTRGWFYDAEKDADRKVLMREVGRLKASIELAIKTGKEPIAFLHYPPVYYGEVCKEMMAVLKEYGIRRCYYGHIHGPSIRNATEGEYDGIKFRLISADALKFLPVLVERD